MIEDYIKLFPKDDNNIALLRHSHPSGWKNPEPAPFYNLVVIGCGPAGLGAVKEAVKIGAKVAIVERGFLGGNYLVNGGIPMQCLARSLRNAGEMARAPRYGVTLMSDMKTDFSIGMERMRYLRSQAAERCSAEVLSKMGVDVFLGEALFTGKNVIEMDNKAIKFQKAIIAAGANPTFPAVDGLKEANPLVYTNIFNMTTLPKRTAIVGGGFAACEIAQLLSRFGSKVIMIMRSGILSHEDAEVSAFVSEILSKEGVTMLSGRLRRVHLEGGNKILIVDITNGQKRIEADEIILATGTTPNITGMGLEFAGVEYDKKDGIKVNFMLQTSNRNIYAAGDVCSGKRFGNFAAYTGEVAARNALIPFWIEKASKDFISWTLNTDPPISSTGMTEKEAADGGIETETYSIRLSEIDRALVDGDENGFIMVHTNKKNNIIVGAVAGCNSAHELGALFSVAIRRREKLRNFRKLLAPFSAYAAGISMVAKKVSLTRVEGFFKEMAQAWLQVQQNSADKNIETDIPKEGK